MFMFKNREPDVSKCYFTHTDIAIQLDEKNLPTRKVPFSTIGKHPFVHTVRLLQYLHPKNAAHNQLGRPDATRRSLRHCRGQA